MEVKMPKINLLKSNFVKPADRKKDEVTNINTADLLELVSHLPAEEAKVITKANLTALPIDTPETDRVNQANFPPANTGNGIYADCYGKISHLALQVDTDAWGSVHSEVMDTYKTLFKHMSPDTKFTICAENENTKKELEELIKNEKIANTERIHIFVSPELDITMWTRDEMIGLFMEGEGGKILNQNTMRPHGDDELLPPLFAKESGCALDVDKRLQTDGGDVVSNSKESFLGYTSLLLTAQQFQTQASQKRGLTSSIVDKYEEITGKNVAVAKEGPVFSQKVVFDPLPRNRQNSFLRGAKIVKNPDYKAPETVRGPQAVPEEQMWLDVAKQAFTEKYGKKITPIGDDDPATPIVETPATFHIDMGMTPIDDKTIFVGDPQKAINVIKGLSKEEYDRNNKQLQNELQSQDDVLAKLVAENEATDPSGVNLLQHNFDKNAEKVKKEGYEIDRLPYLQGWSGSMWENVPWVTYNNCIMEQYPDKDGKLIKKVYLPTFCDALDKVAKETYANKGFEVVPLRLAALTTMRGAIRCISNILGKSPEA